MSSPRRSSSSPPPPARAVAPSPARPSTSARSAHSSSCPPTPVRAPTRALPASSPRTSMATDSWIWFPPTPRRPPVPPVSSPSSSTLARSARSTPTPSRRVSRFRPSPRLTSSRRISTATAARTSPYAPSPPTAPSSCSCAIPRPARATSASSRGSAWSAPAAVTPSPSATSTATANRTLCSPTRIVHPSTSSRIAPPAPDLARTPSGRPSNCPSACDPAAWRSATSTRMAGLTSPWDTTARTSLRSSLTFRSNSFGPPLELPVGLRPRCLAVGDLDADGWPDIAVGHDGTNVVALISNLRTASLTTNSFTPANLESTLTPISSVAIADLNGDGTNDVLITFDSVSALALADLNGDGKPDVAVLNQLSSLVTLFENTSVGGNITFNAVPGTVLLASSNPAALRLLLADLNHRRRGRAIPA